MLVAVNLYINSCKFFVSSKSSDEKRILVINFSLLSGKVFLVVIALSVKLLIDIVSKCISISVH